jgi:SpoVK/Ycf46/Vps4 family AAA+-type ATPase
MSSAKSKSKAVSAAAKTKDDILVNIVFQARTASISSNDRVCSPEMLFLSGGDMRSLSLKPGSCAVVISAEAPSGMVFQVWPSSKSLGGNATLNRVWWPNFNSATDSRPAQISRLSGHIKMLPCSSVRFAVLSGRREDTVVSDVESVSPIPLSGGNLRQFCDHVRAHLLDGSILRIRQRLGVTWKTKAYVIEVVGLISSDSGENLAENDDCDQEYCYRISGSTVFSFADSNEASDNMSKKSSATETKDSSILGKDAPTSADEIQASFAARGFGSYPTQIQTVLSTARLALTPTSAISSGVSPLVQTLFKPPRGVLVHGPPGTGKTLLLRTAVQVLQLQCPSLGLIELPPSLLLKAYTGDAERELMQIFEEAQLRAPCILLIDDADTLCKRRDDSSNGAGSAMGSAEAQKRLLSCLLTLIDGSNASAAGSGVLLLAATSRPNDMDPAMRRPGRLDVEVELGVPTADERVDILFAMLSAMRLDNDGANRNAGGLTRTSIESIARTAHGHVAADMLLGVKEASILATARAHRTVPKEDTIDTDSKSLIDAFQMLKVADIDDISSDSDISAATIGKNPNHHRSVYLTDVDLKQGMSKVTPSALQEAVAEIPTVYWSDIGGMSGVKQALKEVVEWPLQYPHLFQQLKVNPPQGVLLYGPPGCSKTLMAKALATESGMNFLSVRGPELLSKWLGESEKAIQTLFRRARAASPCIVFFDEIDSLAGKRGSSSAGVSDRVLAQLLSELDGITSNRVFGSVTGAQVILIAATNRPDVLDKALMRPGRIDRKVYVPPPDFESRRAILKLEMVKVPMKDDVDIDSIAHATSGFSGAEVVAITTEAAMLALDEEAPEVSRVHIDKALGDMKPQITEDMLRFYETMEL